MSKDEAVLAYIVALLLIAGTAYINYNNYKIFNSLFFVQRNLTHDIRR